jgi:hypothetical protein
VARDLAEAMRKSLGGVSITVENAAGAGGTIGANNAALMGVYVLPLVAHWIFHAGTRPRTLLAIVALLVNILGIVSTESRAGFLNMALVLVFFDSERSG